MGHDQEIWNRARLRVEDDSCFFWKGQRSFKRKRKKTLLKPEVATTCSLGQVALSLLLRRFEPTAAREDPTVHFKVGGLPPTKSRPLKENQQKKVSFTYVSSCFVLKKKWPPTFQRLQLVETGHGPNSGKCCIPRSASPNVI